MIEGWDPHDDPILVQYAEDKLDQLNAMESYVPGVGYSWERKDETMGSAGELIATRTHSAYLNPEEITRIRDNAKFHLVTELKAVGINIFKGVPHDY